MSTDLSECQECHKTPENSSSSSSLDDGIIRRGRRHGRTYPTSKRKILVCNSRKAPEFRMPSNEELKRREVAQNAIREAMLDYQVSACAQMCSGKYVV